MTKAGSNPSHVPAGAVGAEVAPGDDAAADAATGDAGPVGLGGGAEGVGVGAIVGVGMGCNVESSWVKFAQRYSRGVNPESWIFFARSRPT